MALNWIDVSAYPFDSLLLLERFQIRYMLGFTDECWRRSMGAALRAHPYVAWYLARRCPERKETVAQLMAQPAPEGGDVRADEIRVLASVEDFITYTTPEIMNGVSDYIYAWDARRLHEMLDLTGMRVLDVGAGSGRLTFAAAKVAKEVYAVEPVATLREYLRDTIKQADIRNIRVTWGMADNLPYPDGTFDAVISGHVVGDDYDGELAEIARVVKSGGYIIDCPGEDPRPKKPSAELRARGFEEMYYRSKLGGDVYRYRKQVFK